MRLTEAFQVTVLVDGKNCPHPAGRHAECELTYWEVPARSADKLMRMMARPRGLRFFRMVIPAGRRGRAVEIKGRHILRVRAQPEREALR